MAKTPNCSYVVTLDPEKRTAPLTWADLQRDWDEQNRRWDEAMARGEMPRDPLGRDTVYLSPKAARAWRDLIGLGAK